MSQLISLNVIRYFAGIWVVAFHVLLAYEELNGRSNSWLRPFFADGHHGVGLFFTLSGYLITHTIIQRHSTHLIFAIKRFSKIVPIYFILTIAFFILSRVEFLPINSTFDVDHLFYSTLFLSQPVIQKPPVLYVGWSLEYEVLYYILVYIALLFRIKSIYLKFFILLAFAMVLDYSYAYFSFGTALCMLRRRTTAKVSIKVFEFSFQVACLLGVWFFLKDYYLFLFLLLFVGSYFRFVQFENTIFTRTASLLAGATYSIYLLQIFTIPLILKTIHYLNLSLSLTLTVVITLAVTTVLGILCYRYVENPLEYKIRSYFDLILESPKPKFKGFS